MLFTPKYAFITFYISFLFRIILMQTLLNSKVQFNIAIFKQGYFMKIKNPKFHNKNSFFSTPFIKSVKSKIEDSIVWSEEKSIALHEQKNLFVKWYFWLRASQKQFRCYICYWSVTNERGVLFIFTLRWYSCRSSENQFMKSTHYFSTLKLLKV
jgi:hypothetical protein